MIGQHKLLSQIDNISSIDQIHTTLIVGLPKSGKSLIVERVAEKFNLPVEDITDNLSLEAINSIATCSFPSIYKINLASVSIKEQNVILKFIEEPLKNAYIFLEAYSLSTVLPTVKNRCQIWNIEKYTVEELTQYFNTKYPALDFFAYNQCLSYAETLGDVDMLVQFYEQLPVCEQLVNKMLTKMSRASVSNALTITNKLAFKGEQDKLNFGIFIKVFKNKIFAHIDSILLSNSSTQEIVNALTQQKICSDFFNSLYIPNINTKMLFDNMLIKLKSFTVEK